MGPELKRCLQVSGVNGVKLGSENHAISCVESTKGAKNPRGAIRENATPAQWFWIQVQRAHFFPRGPRVLIFLKLNPFAEKESQRGSYWVFFELRLKPQIFGSVPRPF